MGNVIFNNMRTIKLNLIKANPNQPRKYFDDDAIVELASSIRRCGLINPISVRKTNGEYQIVAGERRYRASRLAGLKEIPCIVVENDEQSASIIAIVENIQRYDLNFVEEAIAYLKLMHDFNYKQEEIAKKVGKTQSAVANKMRILKLGESMLNKVIQNGLTERHARTLLRVQETNREQVLEHIIKNRLNVAKTEEYIDKILKIKAEKPKKYIKIKADVRYFINSINKAIETMKLAGIGAQVEKEKTEEGYTYTIKIPA